MGIATTTQTAAVRELSDQNSQGTRLGATANDLIGFLGATTLTAQSTIVGSLTLNSTIGGAGFSAFGFTSATIAAAVLNAVSELKRKGFIG